MPWGRALGFNKRRLSTWTAEVRRAPQTMTTETHGPTDDRLHEVASADAGVGWCRACGVERESVELDARGCACGSCGAPAVDGGVQIWMLDRVRQSHPALREQQLLPIGAAFERLTAGDRSPPWANEIGNHTAAGWQTTIVISTTTPGCWHPAPVDRGGPRAPPPASDNLRRVRT